MNSKSEHIQKVIEDTRQFINDQWKFEDIVKNLYDSVEYIERLRLSKWLTFFNENYYSNPCLFSNTIFALFEAIQTNELFKTQSEHEFDISIKFYEKIIRTHCFMGIDTIENAKHLLYISLVYGKYPGMQVRSMFEAIKILKKGINETSLNQIFEYVFVKYENPTILTYNLKNLDLIEIEILMFTLQGHNIRSHPEIPQPISKKESYILVNKIPDYFRFKDNILKRSIVTSKLILASNNTTLLQKFYSTNKTYKYKINTFLNDIIFWSEVYNFLLKIDWDTIQLGIQEFNDYFEYMKNRENEKFSIKGRTINSVAEAIFNWHENSEYHRTKELINLSWKGSRICECEIIYEDEKYLFKELKNGEEIFRESDEMHHCAYSYIEDCANNYCSLWSMRKEVNTIFKHYLTIEVQEKTIVQIAGKCNRKPTPKDMDIIKKWRSKKRILIDLET